MATTISVIGLLLAAIIFVVAIWKGLDVFTSTILVSFIIILTSWMDWWTSLSSYAEGYVGFIQNNVFVLVIGAVFGELMAASGCAESIANVVTEKMGAKRVILSIALITTVFVYVGVSGFVVLFVLAPIATIMMKQAGYPYRMIPGIIFIGATCSAMIPYAINITNIMPAQYLGTSMGSAPILGFSGVLQSCPGFQSIINFVMGLKMNPYLTEFFGLNILAGILGSGTSSIAMFFEHLSDGLLAKGASAGALHRLAPACATGMNTLPNAGGMVAQLRWMKLSLAESYWYVFMTSVLAPMIGSLAAVIVAMIIY